MNILLQLVMYSNSKYDYGSISITISSDTLCISSIENNMIYTNDIKIEPGANIFDLFKAFKPVYAEYPILNALLTEIKMIGKGGSHYSHRPITFKNNNNFLDNIVKVTAGFTCNEFTIEFSSSNTIIIKPCLVNNDTLLLDDQAIINPSIIKHELANSLNIINMSSILLNSGINSITGPGDTITKLDKYSKIIKTELDHTISLLNTVNKFASDTKNILQQPEINYGLYSSGSTESRIKLPAFYDFILSYLTDINKLYPIYEDGQIYIENPVTPNINKKYINIQLPWIKIVLDNIFKNIYGHLGNITNKKFNSLDLTYNEDLQQLIINIYNEIIPNTCNNITKCELYTDLRNKYNLIHCDQEILPCKQYNTGQGLNLIDILCSKLNISWSLIEVSADIYVFKLAIPVYNSSLQTTASTSSLMCRRDYSSKTNNKYNIYLNDRIQYLHTTTI